MIICNFVWKAGILCGSLSLALLEIQGGHFFALCLRSCWANFLKPIDLATDLLHCVLS